ncbi:MAG: hypothetical protein WBG08_11725 [Litorimonas sp.]
MTDTTTKRRRGLPICRPGHAGLSLALAAFGASAFASPALAQLSGPSPVDLDGAYLPDFSYAGYGFGERPIPDMADATLIDVTHHGVVADDGKDDSKALQSALQEARRVSGPVVLSLPKGRIVLSDILKLDRSDLVLRGQGKGQGGSEIYIPRPLSYIDTGDKFDEIRTYLKRFDKVQRDADQNVEWPFSEYSWTGGFLWIGPQGHRAAAYLEELDVAPDPLAVGTDGERGALSFQVSDASRLRTGDDVELVWFSRDGEAGPLLPVLYGDTELKVGSHHWTFPDRGLVRQKTVIRAIEGDRVTIADPLLHPLSETVTADILDWSPLTDVGIEDLRIAFSPGTAFGHHLEQGFNAVYFTGTRNGWVRDVAVHDADSAVLSYSSANLTFDNMETSGDRVAHYAVHIGNVHNALVSDLVVRNRVVHPMTVNTQSTKAVYLRTQVHRQPVLDQHAGANHQNLFDQTVLHLDAAPGPDGPSYPVWDGSGAGYWQPGHGRFNTTYNLELRIGSGASRTEPVAAQGLAEGPDARLLHIWGNRPLMIDYRPEPLIQGTNEAPEVASLYEWQLARRVSADTRR